MKCVVDVRLNNTSQLSGFAKAKDLVFFLKSLGEIDYVHEPLLAPTKDILDAFRKHKGSWDEYEKRFLGLMDERRLTKGLIQVCLTKAACYAAKTNPITVIGDSLLII